MSKEIKSGEDYAKLLVETLKEGGPEDDMPKELIEYWCENVYEAAVKSYNNYLAGKRKDFLLTEKEMEQAYENAGLRYTEDLVNGLLDKDMIQAGVRNDGEIVYSLTEKGKKYTL
jgi:hypothetical protein